MKKKDYIKNKRAGFINPKLINTMIILALIMIFAGPVIYVGSFVMKLIAFVLLINIIPFLLKSKGNSNNFVPLLAFTALLAFILFFRRSSVIITILLILLILKGIQKLFDNPDREGHYKYTKSNNFYDRTSSGGSVNYNGTSYNQPKDPFSYRKRQDEVVDVEYEDWDTDYSKPNYSRPAAGSNNKTAMDYSYSSSFNEESSSEESEGDFRESYNPFANQKVYIGSIKKTIHQDDLQIGNNELFFNCKLGDLDLIIDSRVETDINCFIKAGEIRVGDEIYSGFSQKIRRRWSPNNASNRYLKLNCEVGLGEIRIRHRKLN